MDKDIYTTLWEYDGGFDVGVVPSVLSMKTSENHLQFPKEIAMHFFTEILSW